MATFTSFLNLRKPATSDNVDVTLDISNNMDEIDTAIQTLAGRVDDSEDSGKQLATGLEVGPVFLGDNLIAETNSFASDGLRKMRISCFATGQASVSAGTGHIFTIQRELNNSGTWNAVGDQFWIVWPSTTIVSSIFFETFESPPAGSVQYRVRAQGHGINGNRLQNVRVVVYDAGLG